MDEKKLKIAALNKVIKELFNGITEEDILKVLPDGTFMVADKVLPASAKNDIITGAQALKEMLVFQVLLKDMKHLANKMMYENSKDVDDMVFGKAMLYNIDVLERKIDNLSKLPQSKE
jgi:hypothetical protein